MASPSGGPVKDLLHAMRKRALPILAVLLLSATALFSYAFLFEPQYGGLLTDDGRVLVFAHRGFGNHAPDNSLAGARLALEKGLDGVDVDGQFSADKQVVIFHDPSLERFTTGTGRVDSKTVQELRTYDLSIKFGNGFSEVYISTFDDFVRTVTPEAYLMVELKVPGVADTGMEQQVSEIIQKYDAYDRVFISSFNPVVLYRIKRIEPRVRTVFIFQDTGWDEQRVSDTREEDRVALPWYLRTERTRVAIRKIIGADALSIHQDVEESVIDKLMAKGVPVFLWPLNDRQSVTWALGKSPYGLVSDEPLQALELRDEFE